MTAPNIFKNSKKSQGFRDRYYMISAYKIIDLDSRDKNTVLEAHFYTPYRNRITVVYGAVWVCPQDGLIFRGVGKAPGDCAAPRPSVTAQALNEIGFMLGKNETPEETGTVQYLIAAARRMGYFNTLLVEILP